MKPLDHQPLAELVAALKASGHERIAQGTQQLWQADPKTGTASKTSAPVALTMNHATGSWTVIAFHDDTVGSTYLVGTTLRRIADNEPLPSFDRDLAQTAISRLGRYGATYYPDHLKNLTEQFRMRRLFSGEIVAMTAPAFAAARGYRQSEIDAHKLRLNVGGKDVDISQGDLRRIMAQRVGELKATGPQGQNPVENQPHEQPESTSTMEPLFADVLVRPDGGFMVLAVDRHGACLTIAVGDTFSERQR